METKKIAISGIITEATYSKKFNDKQPYYRVSIKVTEETRSKVAEIAKPFFESTAPEYIPAWLTGESLYINLKSKYPVSVLDDKTKEEHVITEHENIAGSKGNLLATLKDSGMYLSGLVIKDKNAKSLQNFFTDDLVTV